MKRAAFDAALVRLHACEEAREWCAKPSRRKATFAQLWKTCPRGDWMLWLAGAAGVDRKLLVLAACDCARLVLKHTTDPRVLKCIETAEAWCRGEATMDELLAARRAAYAYAYAAAADAAAAYAADADDAVRATTLRKCAALVRKRITAATIARAL